MFASKTAGMLTATTVALVGTTALAQNGPARPVPMTTQQVAYYADDAAAEGTCGSPECCEPAACSACDPCGCDAECCGGGCECGCDLGEPWTLFGETCCGLTVGGWVSSGIYGNAHGAAGNGPLGFNDVGDGYTLNQLWIYAEKAADTGGCGFDWGFRVDYLFGVDGPDTQAFGGLYWDNDWDTARDYGSALPQLYAEFAVNNLSIKAGHFFTIIGWEVGMAPDDFFYSHAYAMYYAEPFTHTGVLATYQFNDAVTGWGGWTQGWDTGFDNSSRASTFLGGLSVALSDNATLIWACSAGDFGVDAGDIYMNSFVFDFAVTDKLTYVLQHDLGNNTGLGDGNNEWYGINQYLQYQLNDCWAIGGRFEWFRDDDGARISTNGTAVGNYYALTAGLNWRPHANVTVRPEVRYDWFDGTAAAGELPFNDGDDDTQLSGGFDLIVTF